jgi:hypothetical protein
MWHYQSKKRHLNRTEIDVYRGRIVDFTCGTLPYFCDSDTMGHEEGHQFIKKNYKETNDWMAGVILEGSATALFFVSV